MRAWLFQDTRQKRKLGDKAPWSVGWYDPAGRKRSKRIGSHSAAEKYQRKIEGQLAAGTYQADSAKTWDAFRKAYEEKVLTLRAVNTREAAKISLDHFERIVRPKKLKAITTPTIADFVAQRSQEQGGREGTTVSPASVNKDLRHVKAALRVAQEWEYLPTVPKFRMVREAKKLPRYVTPEHFAAIYKACDVARMPRGLPYEPVDWWRGLLIFCYMTGWRISEPLALRREDVDLKAGYAITRAEDNKGNRDDQIPLHSIILDHLERLAGFSPKIFPWNHHRRSLWEQFQKIQEAAGIHLPCAKSHEHNDRCHVYGFHDLRRAFATLNAKMMTVDALQALMRHKSYTTTQRYINFADEVTKAVENLHVPEFLRREAK